MGRHSQKGVSLHCRRGKAAACGVRQTATRRLDAWQLVPLADYDVYIDTPTVTAITAKDATDTEKLRIIDVLTVQP